MRSPFCLLTQIFEINSSHEADLKVKLLPTEKPAAILLETFREADAACNRISEKAGEDETFNPFRIHKLVCHDLKRISLKGGAVDGFLDSVK